VDERLWVDRVAPGRETRGLGEASHRGHRGVVGERLLVDRLASGRENARIGGKHRTEVTEITEVGVAWWAKGFRWTGWLHGGKRAHRQKASHGGHGEGTGEVCWDDVVGQGACIASVRAELHPTNREDQVRAALTVLANRLSIVV
jgi:hypothetical protein